MVRIDIGPYMLSLRQHYGLSQQDVASRLHLRIKYVQAIEVSQFDALPGKVYAKGYVHSYAEFLGLDPEQVVERCFGAEFTRESQEHFIPATARESAHLPKGWLKMLGVVAAIGMVYSVFFSPVSEDGAIMVSERAGAVPEEMLAPMRNAVMPTSRNIDCLKGRGHLSCFFAARQTTRWILPKEPPSYTAISAPYGNPLPEKKKSK